MSLLLFLTLISKNHYLDVNKSNFSTVFGAGVKYGWPSES